MGAGLGLEDNNGESLKGDTGMSKNRNKLGRFIKGHTILGREKGAFRKGHTINNGKHRSPKTEFKKGQKHSANWYKIMENFIPWNKGISMGYINSQGYKVFYILGKEIKEQRLIMEQYLGRYLKSEEEVHHINGNRLDNRLENLKIVTKSEHAKIHYPEKKEKLVYRGKQKCAY